MGLQLSSTKKKKPFLSSHQQRTHHEEKHQLLLSSPSRNQCLSISGRNVSASSSVSSTASSSSDSCCELLVGTDEPGENCTHAISASLSKNAANSAATRHKLQQKLKKPENDKFPTCILHIKVARMKTTDKNNHSPRNYFSAIAGPTIPLTTGGRPKPSSVSFELLAKHHLYYQHAYSYPGAKRPKHYMGQHVRHAHFSAAAAVAAPRTGGRHQSFGKRKPNSTAAAAAAAAAAVAAAAAATQKTAATATAGRDTAPRSTFYGMDESHRLRTESHFTSYSFCRWFEASSGANPSHTHSGGLYPLDSSTPYCAKHVQDVYCPLDTLDMWNKLAHWFLFPIANDIDLDTECTYNRYLGGNSSSGGSVGEVDLFQGLTSFLSSIVRKVFQVDFSQSIGTTFQDSPHHVQQVPNHPEDIKNGHAATLQVSQCTTRTHAWEEPPKGHDINHPTTTSNNMDPSHTLFHSISSIDSEEARCSSSGTSNITQQRYLDIECILRLPTMIYDEEGSSSDGFVGSIDTYDTDGGKSIKIDHEDAVHLVDDSKGLPSSQQNVSNHHNAISLEWSWITVPRQDDPLQSIHSMASLEETPHDAVHHHHHHQDNNNNKEDGQCVICLFKFQRGERLCILPCHHSVHTTCIDKWICSTGSCGGSFSHDECRNALCPMCQYPLGVDNDHLHRGGNDGLHSIKSIASEESFVVDHRSLDEDDSIKSMNLDGLVPSWAFERLGSKIAK